jgi:hypothetical protein
VSGPQRQMAIDSILVSGEAGNVSLQACSTDHKSGAPAVPTPTVMSGNSYLHYICGRLHFTARGFYIETRPRSGSALTKTERSFVRF